MFRSIVLSACLAGLGAGIVLTLAQQPTVAPIILEAETYESAAAPTQASTATTAPADVHESSAWAPGDGLERTFWSLVSNVGVAIGFALLLCAVYTLLPNITPARGMLWGLAGFVVFFANPGIGLHPEIPGTVAADLFNRQLWWSFAAICSAAAVALIAWRRVAWTWGAAAALLVLPHLIGAPQPDVHGSLAPQALAQQFIWATTLVNAVFWLALGGISALAFRRFAAQPVAV
jgi:cobalt transporter subunit CbtA